MTLVVSDNSPLNLLVRVGAADVLPALFQRVVIPPEVAAEMSHPRAPAEVRAFIAALPPWLTTQPPTALLALPNLDPGETAGISLAAELGATILIDERDGRAEAQARGSPSSGPLACSNRRPTPASSPTWRQFTQRFGDSRFTSATSS